MIVVIPDAVILWSCAELKKSVVTIPAAVPAAVEIPPAEIPVSNEPSPL